MTKEDKPTKFQPGEVAVLIHVNGARTFVVKSTTLGGFTNFVYEQGQSGYDYYVRERELVKVCNPVDAYKLAATVDFIQDLKRARIHDAEAEAAAEVERQTKAAIEKYELYIPETHDD